MITKVKLFATLGIASVVFSSGFYFGGLKGKLDLAEHKKRSALELVEAQRGAMSDYESNNLVTIESSKLDALRQKKNEVIEREVIKEVIRYEENPNAGLCDLPDEWVRNHDYAASGSMPAVPDATTEPDDGARRITDIEALEVVAENYLSCNDTREQLILLQRWVESIR